MNKFRSSSPLYPIAVPQLLMTLQAVVSVTGVTGQEMEIVGYIQADELNALLHDTLVDMDYSN